MHFEKVSYEQFRKDCVLPQELTHSEQEMYLKGIYDGIRLPVRATPGSAGYDFFVPQRTVLRPGVNYRIPTGIRCPMDPGWVLMLCPRSGLGVKYGTRLTNTVGVIDSDYAQAANEGHIQVFMTAEKEVALEAGDRFCQGIFLRYGWTEDDSGSAEEQRTGGFGSTNGGNA